MKRKLLNCITLNWLKLSLISYLYSQMFIKLPSIIAFYSLLLMQTMINLLIVQLLKAYIF